MTKTEWIIKGKKINNDPKNAVGYFTKSYTRKPREPDRVYMTNGVYYLNTGKFEYCDTGGWSGYAYPAPYDPSAECPVIEYFLEANLTVEDRKKILRYAYDMVTGGCHDKNYILFGSN